MRVCRPSSETTRRVPNQVLPTNAGALARPPLFERRTGGERRACQSSPSPQPSPVYTLPKGEGPSSFLAIKVNRISEHGFGRAVAVFSKEILPQPPGFGNRYR